MLNPLCTPHDHNFSRRQILGLGAAGAIGLGGLGGMLEPAVAEELRTNEKQVIFIWLDGGLSQLESWDPKPNTQFGGPFRAISTSVPGVQFCELLPKTSQLMHHLTVVRSVATQDNSHSAGVARINRGDPKNRGVVYPYFGSAVAKLLGPTSKGLPPYMWVKPMSGGFKTGDAGFLGPKYGALALGDGKAPPNILLHEDIPQEENEIRNELRVKMNQRYAEKRFKQNTEANSYVFDMSNTLMKQEALFDESTIPERDKQRYGTHELGRHMLVGRRLLEAGVRFVKVNSYGWDSHGDNFNACDSTIRKFDQAYSALIEDLHERGMLDNVLIIAMSEFGRTPKINSHVGRDHWPEAWSVCMGGTGLKSGTVIGKTNAKGTDVDGQKHDIGHLFHTWFHALGVPEEKMSYDNDGQPLPVANEECFPIKEALA